MCHNTMTSRSVTKITTEEYFMLVLSILRSCKTDTNNMTHTQTIDFLDQSVSVLTVPSRKGILSFFKITYKSRHNTNTL